jgi:O-antigen ligase
VVFWSARSHLARDRDSRLLRSVALTGLFAALAAIVLSATSDVSLIYGRWQPRDAGARTFGPFVNRNHFATWVLMACPLAAGYVAAALDARRRSRAPSTLAVWLESLGTGVVWVGIASVVMILALVMSTSRSGLIGLGASLVAAIWLGRDRRTIRITVVGGLLLIGVAAIVLAYVNVQPLVSRVEETVATGAGGRPRVWQETTHVVRDFWPAGTGLGAYQTAMRAYQQTERMMFINQAHNQYLQLLAEGGVLVTAPAIVAVAAFVRLFRARLAHDTTSSVWLRIGGGAALVAVAVQGIWETGLRMPANGLLFAIAAAVAVHDPPQSRMLDE